MGMERDRNEKLFLEWIKMRHLDYIFYLDYIIYWKPHPMTISNTPNCLLTFVKFYLSNIQFFPSASPLELTFLSQFWLFPINKILFWIVISILNTMYVIRSVLLTITKMYKVKLLINHMVFP